MSPRLHALYCLQLIFGFSFALATEVHLPGGEVLKDAKMIGIEGSIVVVEHSSGVERLSVSDLSQEVREQFGIKPTLASARADYESASEAVRIPFDRLNNAYRNRLETLAAAAQSEGSLEQVLEIMKELENFEVTQFVPNLKHPPLAEAREIYDLEVEKLRPLAVAKIESLLSQYREQVEAIQRQLTQENEIEEAMSARAEQESILALMEDPMQAFADIGIVLSPPPRPERIPVTAPSPTGQALCRMVFIKVVEGGEQDPPSFEAVESSDFTDFVSVGRVDYPLVGAIRSDGTIVAWENGSAVPSVIPGDNVAMEYQVGIPFFGLDRNGTLNVSENGPAGIIADLRSQTNVEAFAATPGAVVILERGSGKLSVVAQSSHPNTPILSSQDEVKDIVLAGLSFVALLKNDGTVMRLTNGVASEVIPPEDLMKLYSSHMGLSEKGEIVVFGNAPSFVYDFGDDPRQVLHHGGLLCAIDEDGKFHCYVEDETNQWKNLPDVEDALEGLVAFAPIYATKSRWIAALLPHEEVPRSGAWDPEDLKDARR